MSDSSSTKEEKARKKEVLMKRLTQRMSTKHEIVSSKSLKRGKKGSMAKN